MKNIKSFLIMDFIILLFKLIGGLLCNSYTMMFSSLYEVVLMVVLLFSIKKDDKDKKNSIISLLVSIVLILVNIIGIVYVLKKDIIKPSLWLIIFIILTLLLRYVIQCFKTMKSFNMKSGLLSISNMISNYDFYMAGIVLLSLILCKISKWVSVLKYSDIIGMIVISLFIIVKLVRIIINSIKSRNSEFEVPEEYRKEITDRSEVKKINSLKISNYGGFRTIVIDLELKSGIGNLDANSFIVTLTDYLLKKCEVVEVWLGQPKVNGGLNNKLAMVRQRANQRKSSNKKRRK